MRDQLAIGIVEEPADVRLCRQVAPRLYEGFRVSGNIEEDGDAVDELIVGQACERSRRMVFGEPRGARGITVVPVTCIIFVSVARASRGAVMLIIELLR
ncbi:MAG: hypothetical protein AAGF11_53145 [Myxococcota bacterium]